MAITWDSSFENTPAGNESLGQGDDRIRELKTEIRERMQQGGHLMQDSDPSIDGRHATDVDGSGYFRVFKSDHSATVFRAKDEQAYFDVPLYCTKQVEIATDSADGLAVTTAAGEQFRSESTKTTISVDGESQLEITDGSIQAQNGAVFKDSDGNEIGAGARGYVLTIAGTDDVLNNTAVFLPGSCEVAASYGYVSLLPTGSAHTSVDMTLQHVDSWSGGKPTLGSTESLGTLSWNSSSTTLAQRNVYATPVSAEEGSYITFNMTVNHGMSGDIAPGYVGITIYAQ